MPDRYIEDANTLAEFSQKIKQQDWITIDTEFIREKTYSPQLCLIQIATADEVVCIDPLELNDLEPLLDALYDPKVIKVFHAARQDLEIFFMLRGAIPTPLFDTQIAAALLGYGDQIGYGNLVQKMLGVNLDKAHSRTDWSLRPLSPDQLHYAADDVRYLREVYLKQMEMLEKQQRLTWLEEDFQHLADSETYLPDSEQMWQKLRGGNRLKGVQLAVLQQLITWREEQAREQDKPRKWLLADDVALELARLRPHDQQAMKRIRSLDEGKRKRYGDTWLTIIRRAEATPKEEWPILEARPRLSVQEEALLDLLTAVVKLSGVEHSISPASLASRRDMENLLHGEETPLLHGWRAELCGHRLKAIINGESHVAWDPSTKQLKVGEGGAR